MFKIRLVVPASCQLLNSISPSTFSFGITSKAERRFLLFIILIHDYFVTLPGVTCCPLQLYSRSDPTQFQSLSQRRTARSLVLPYLSLVCVLWPGDGHIVRIVPCCPAWDYGSFRGSLSLPRLSLTGVLDRCLRHVTKAVNFLIPPLGNDERRAVINKHTSPRRFRDDCSASLPFSDANNN